MSTAQPLSRPERRRLERERRTQERRQPYLERLLAACGADPSVAPPGRLTLVSVAHDGWCPELTGGLCRCDPAITLETLPTWSDAA